MSRCTDTANVPVIFSQHYLFSWGTMWRYMPWILPHTNTEWMSSNTHPSATGAKYKKGELEQERAHGGQGDRSPIGTKKKLRANIREEETKAQLEPQRKLHFSNEECNKSPTDANNNTHPHTSMKATVTVVHKHMLSVVNTSSYLPWCDVGVTCMWMFENDLALRKPTYNRPWMNTGSSRWTPILTQRSDLEPCLWSWPMPSAVEIANSEGQMPDQCQMVQKPVVQSALACLCDCQGESLHQSLWQQLMDSVWKCNAPQKAQWEFICLIVQTIHMWTIECYSIYRWWCRSGMVSFNVQPLTMQTLVLTFFL